MSTPLGTKMSPQRRKLLRYLETPLTCDRCKRQFTQALNLGRWECPKYHPRLGLTSDSPYPCCRRPAGSYGCARADHIGPKGDQVSMSDEEHAIGITSDDALLVASLTKLPLDQVKQAQSWTLDTKTGVWRIARLDIAARRMALGRADDLSVIERPGE